MRILIDTGVYDSAAQDYLAGNQVALMGHHDLAAALDAYAAMAGDDATSQDFARTYDQAAAGALATYADIVDAYATLTLLTRTSATNHARAEISSTLAPDPLDRPDPPGACLLPVGPDRTDLLVPGQPTTARALTPPSSLGANDTDLPHLWDLVVDHLQGWAWPDADTTRLRAAAATWTSAAADLDQLTGYATAALSRLEQQRSPEIAVATTATTRLTTATLTLQSVCLGLAEACETYATTVEEHRDIIRGLLEDMAIQAGISLTLGAITGLFSFGAGTEAGAAVAGWRIVALARKIIAALTALREALRATAVARLAAVIERLGPLRTLLLRYRIGRDAQHLAEVRHITRLTKLKDFTWGRVVGYNKGKDAMLPLDHIWKMHGPLSTVADKGRFAAGTTRAEIQHLAELAARRGIVRADSAVIEYNVGYRIGVDMDGDPSSVLRIIVRNGEIHTAFPI